MAFRFIIACIAFALLQGCHRSAVHDNTKDVTILISQAEDDHFSLEQRLAYAEDADTLAQTTGNMVMRLEAKRTLAGIQLMIGNLKAAKTDFLLMAAIADTLSDFENIGIAWNNLGIIFDNCQEYDSALSCYSKAITNFSKNNNRLQVARCMVNIGIVELNRENYDVAFQTSTEAAKILDTLKAQDELASVYITLGITLKKQTALDNAMSYFEKAQQILTNEKDTAGIATVLVNIGDTYRERKQYSEALKSYKQSLAMKTQLGLHPYTGNVLDNLADIYMLLNEIDSAKKYCEQALDVWINNNSKEGIFTASNKLAELALIKNDFAMAIIMANQVRTQFPDKDFLSEKLKNSAILYQAYRNRKQYDSAIVYANSVIALKDSLFQVSMAANVASMDAKFRNNEIRRELLFSQRVQAVQVEKIHTQLNFLLLLAISSVLLSAFLALLFFSLKKIKKAKKQIETLMSELNHRVKNNLQIISDMLHLQMGIASDEAQGSLIQASLNRVQSMNIIHSLLNREQSISTINMKDFIETLISNLKQSYQDKSAVFIFTVNVDDVFLNVDNAIAVGLIMNELITNIFKYGVPVKEQTEMDVAFTKESNKFRLVVTDNCRKWDIENLRRAKRGLGLFLVETLAKQLKATLMLTSDNTSNTYVLEF